MSRSAFEIATGRDLSGRTIIVTGANTGIGEPAELAGQYLKECRVDRSSVESNDPAVAERVWTLSEAWVERTGAVPEWP